MFQITRTSIVCFGLVAGSLSTAGADPVLHETVVHNKTTTVTADLNTSTVLCSSADYGQLFLKVALPELARLTLLNHENVGAGAPCVAAGACAPGNMPADVIDASRPTEKIAVNVKEVRLDETDATAKTCTTQLIERVRVNIRGFVFKHERSLPLVDRPYADCVTSAGQPADGDQPVDDPGEVESAPGGCSTSRGGGSLLLMLAAFAVVRRRRRV